MGDLSKAVIRLDAKRAGLASADPTPPSPLAELPRELPERSAPRGSRSPDSIDLSDYGLVGARLEACRRLAVAVRAALEARGGRTLAVLSALSNEGKSTVVRDLGLAMGTLSAGREIALVDLDLRNPSLKGMLGIEIDQGIGAVLKGRASEDDVRIQLDRPAVDVYPAGRTHGDAHEVLASAAFSDLLERLSDRYPVVLIDTPPVLLFPDPSLILQRASAGLVVARAGFTRMRSYRQLVELVPHERILGQVLSDTRMQHHRAYDRYQERMESSGPPASGGANPA